LNFERDNIAFLDCLDGLIAKTSTISESIFHVVDALQKRLFQEITSKPMTALELPSTAWSILADSPLLPNSENGELVHPAAQTAFDSVALLVQRQLKKCTNSFAYDYHNRCFTTNPIEFVNRPCEGFIDRQIFAWTMCFSLSGGASPSRSQIISWYVNNSNYDSSKVKREC
jgi:hypothetical protein